MNLDFAACIASGQGRTPPAVPRRCVCQLLCLLATRERHRLPPAAAWTESAPLPWPRSTAACPAARAAVCRLLVARSAPGTAGADEGAGGGDKVADDDKFFFQSADYDKLTPHDRGGKRKWKNQDAGVLFSYKLKVEKDIPYMAKKKKIKLLELLLPHFCYLITRFLV